jgi:cytochrome o ubiquinol oxidase operon protein cyoD
MKKLYVYITGFVLSIIFTFISFGLLFWHEANEHAFPTHEIIFPILIMLAIAQLFVQLIFFLHVGHEGKPRWNLIALVFATIVVVIVVGGTLWIMQNLKYGHEHAYNVFEVENITPHDHPDTY